jgi:UDP-sulfoquinovose synthase
MEEHHYNPVHTGLTELGLAPHPLTDEVMDAMMETILRYHGRIVENRIFRGVKWRK